MNNTMRILFQLWALATVVVGCSGAEFTSADPINGTGVDGSSQSDSATVDAGSDGIVTDSGDRADSASNQGSDASSDYQVEPEVGTGSQSIDCPPGETVTRCKLPGGGNPCPVNSTILLICDCDNAACAPNVTYTCRCDS